MASGSGGGDEPSLASRGGESRRKQWLLLAVDRRLLAAVLTVLVFAVVLAWGLAHPVPARTLLSRGTPVATLFQSYVGAIVTGVTLVLTINQLVLSQELGAVGDQSDRMDGAVDFRDEANEIIDTPESPPEPSAFLVALLRRIEDRAAAFRAATDRSADPLPPAVDDFAAVTVADAGTIAERAEGREFGQFHLLLAALNFDYSWKLYAARRTAAEFGGDLSEEATEALDELEAALELFAPTREHFKTLYFQWELVNLSRVILYTSVPALVVASAMVVFFDAAAFPGAVLGVDLALLQVALAVAVCTVPFLLLLAYVLRIATVAKRTLAIGPFVLRETDRPSEAEWE